MRKIREKARARGLALRIPCAAQASFTVEAVFVVSLILFVIMRIMTSAIDMYQQVESVSQFEWAKIQESAEDFRQFVFAQQLMR